MLHFEHINIPTEITNTSNQPYKPHLSACSIYPSHLPWLPRYQHGTQNPSPWTQKTWHLSLAPIHSLRLWLRFGVEACSFWNACSPCMSMGTDCGWPERCFATPFYATSRFEFARAPVSFSLSSLHLLCQLLLSGSQRNFCSWESSLLITARLCNSTSIALQEWPEIRS